MATAFALTSSIRNVEKRSATNSLSSLINILSRMTVTPKVDSEPRASYRDSRIPCSKKTAPLSPSLFTNVSIPSDGHQRMTGSVSSAMPVAPPRRRRIAALPKRHTETPTSLSTLSPPSPLPRGSLLTVVSPNATSHTSAESATRLAVTENAHPDCVLLPSQTSYLRSTLSVQNQAATLGPSTSKSVVSKQRKSHPLHRRTNSQSQPAPSPRQVSASSTLVESRVCVSSRTVSRTPSLVSDTSGIDSSPSSSDELDTPPSTPSSSLLALPTRGEAANNIATFLGSPAMSTHGKQSPGIAKLPRPREKGIHIDFTKGRVGNDSEERPFTFTFSS
jgi:hypothetical protein